ncbi:MAG: endolytic transglycosylase MltG [Deltaproteobacteria bacterium]|nr:endolytic transglycosylase MltG [Deltaproteobacteria bacterium]MBI2210653.1 endolytic transglycosylase MltG [Deltaproteobacteria bacterium]MBI2349241.1 endolytic transglycosylase MltG [Deltaproteobacteria bacterium]MBI2539225.1 endolytic transglycosylase MltG [Deltaproteobacteria bacterium]
MAVKYLLFTFYFAALSALLFAAFLLAFLFRPPLQEPQTVEVKVERGEPLSAIVHRLKDHGVISNERLFSLWARLWRLDKKIHWGLYRFELPLPPRQVLDQMQLGKGLFHRVTVPEGLTVREIAELLEKAAIADKERFLAEAAKAELLSRVGMEGKAIEGYLFPDTYYFTPFVTERDILIAMVEQFRASFSSRLEERAGEIGLDVHQAVTLASLIEKETGVDEERPLISAVFHNRLRARIPLQSDPTVIYGMKRFTGALTRKDLQNPTPYNTYRIPGLPPGPICNPGLAALMAALQPAQVPYLYFVSKNDGSHVFSVSLVEHNRAVRMYQSGKRGRAGG